MGKFDTALRVFRNEGLLPLLRRIYGFAVRRDPIPRRVATFNGVQAKKASILEITDHFPDEEQHSVSQIEQYVSSGDTAVIIGGGWGICAVRLAKVVGNSGEVIVYEGAEQFVKRIEETIRLNAVTDRVTVHHAMVSTEGHVWGAEGDAEHVPPKELPTCDVLQLDCDGAELEILNGLAITPRVVIVEIHGMYGVAEADVDQVMTERGYDIAAKSTFDERHGGYVKTYIQ